MRATYKLVRDNIKAFHLCINILRIILEAGFVFKINRESKMVLWFPVARYSCRHRDIYQILSVGNIILASYITLLSLPKTRQISK